MSSSVVRGLYGRDAEVVPPAGLWARIQEWVLRVPLLVKLLGANLLVDVMVVLEPLAFPGGIALTHPVTVLVLSSLLSTTLVWLALRPIALLEETAERISAGDFDARVPDSRLADRSVARLSRTINRLLNRVQADRARIEYLAGRSARARDIEREAVARELRDSVAQNVAAIALQIAALRRTPLDADAARYLQAAQTTVSDLGEDMRNLAESLHPGTIREFGLANALDTLGRVAGRRTSTAVRVDASRDIAPVPPEAANALYRVADEALRNVVQHARAKHASVTLNSDANGVALSVEDDGLGLDMTRTDPLQSGLGLFAARAVLALAGGELQFSSAPGRGARVTARIPHEAMVRRAWQATS